MSYRCGDVTCNAIVKPYISKAKNTRITEYRTRKIFVPRTNLDTPPAIRYIKEIAKEIAFCPDCALKYDIENMVNEVIHETESISNSNVVRIHR